MKDWKSWAIMLGLAAGLIGLVIYGVFVKG
jgi:hypothetical protein